ncbi:hypothetical protein PR048_020936 [Dryococelus australis]|uniref:Uncharacterized protein n=1 Tax=Dryococelus australis TaxID=614101 RepID=A0ABQ9GWT9_9NEOP|nr:hypothetical protein PR048_020936 [Dryococelus australis]
MHLSRHDHHGNMRRMPDPGQDNGIKTNTVNRPCGISNYRYSGMDKGSFNKRNTWSLMKEVRQATMYSHSASTGIRLMIAPHTILLLRNFCTSIDVEYCKSVKPFEYTMKFVNKDSDQSVFKL